MPTPRKIKFSGVDQRQKNEYSHGLDISLDLLKLENSTVQENPSSINQDKNFLAGGRRSYDIDNSGLNMYWDSLTEREQDVLIGVCEGLTDAEIGVLLSIGYATVKSNIQHIFLKANVRNRKQLMARFRKFNFPRDTPTGRSIDSS